MTKFIGPAWTLTPVLSLGYFYSHAYEIYLRGADSYLAGLLGLLAALVSSLVCPIPLAIWFFGWRNKSASVCLATSILIGAVCLAILYFDPGNRIYAFMAD